jgi:hypothetical protein
MRNVAAAAVIVCLLTVLLLSMTTATAYAQNLTLDNQSMRTNSTGPNNITSITMDAMDEDSEGSGQISKKGRR